MDQKSFSLRNKGTITLLTLTILFFGTLNLHADQGIENPMCYLNLLLSGSCTADCRERVCGEDDGCGNPCIVQTCGAGKQCNSRGKCVIGSLREVVTKRLGGTNSTLDHSGVMQAGWFGEYAGAANTDSKILYHYDNGQRRNIVHIDVTTIPAGSEIVSAQYVMPYDTTDYWSFEPNSFSDGISLYRIIDPAGTGMWNLASISTQYKDGTSNTPWANGFATFSDVVSDTPEDTLYSIGRGEKQFYFFDITSLVREWVNNPAANLGFTFNGSVPSDLMSDPEFRPYLEVTYVKDNGDRQSQPTEIDVFYRSGQTFLTWKELSYAGSFFNMHYRIYRHDQPINKETLVDAELIAEVNQESSRNVARTESHRRADSSYSTLHNYVIVEGEGELSDDAGLYVHSCEDTGEFFYAVTSVYEGNENRVDFSSENSLTIPIDEQVELYESIIQNSYSNSGGSLIQEMVHWADKTMSYKVGHGFNYMVNISKAYLESPDQPVLLEIMLGGRSTRYFNEWTYGGGITIRPDTYMPPTTNSPYDGYEFDNLQTWWSGASSAYKTQQNISDGDFIPYTENRILYNIEFVLNQYNVDENMVYLRGGSMGGTGAMSLGLKHPEVFASISATVGSPNWRLNIGMVDENYNVTEEGWRSNANALWGEIPENTLHENGTPIWDWMNAGWYLLHHIDKEAPFLEMNNGKRDGSVKHFPIPQFYNDIRSSRHGFAARFYDGGHSGYGTSFTPRFGTLLKNESFPALANVSIDDDPGGVDPDSGSALIDSLSPLVFSGDLAGTVNGYNDIEWSRSLKEFSTGTSDDDMVDQAERYELALRLESSASVDQATADITPRRLQDFLVVPGQSYEWKNMDVATGTLLQEGSVVADQYGLITISDFIIRKQTLGNKLILTP